MKRIQHILCALLLLLAITSKAQKRFIGPHGTMELKEDTTIILVRLKDQTLTKIYIDNNIQLYDAKHSKKDVSAFKVPEGRSSRDIVKSFEKDSNVLHVYHALWENDSIPIIINGNVIVGVRADQSIHDAINKAGLDGKVLFVENPFNTWMENNGVKMPDTIPKNLWLYTNKDDVFNVANALYNTGLVSYADPDFYTPINGTGEVIMSKDQNKKGSRKGIFSLFGRFAPSPNDPLYVGQLGYLSDLVNLDSAYLWYAYAKTVYPTTNQGLYICDEGIDISASTKHVDLNALSGWGATAAYTGGIPGSTSSPHGTLTGGVAAAYRNNGLYIAGVAGGANVKTVKLLGNGETTAQIANGINWVATDGYRVSSNSWSYPYASSAGLSAIESAINNCIYIGGPGSTGMLVAFSSGTNTGDPTVFFPGNMADVFTVGAVAGSSGTRQSYSNYGPQMDMVATVPAGGVVTLDRTGSLGANSTDYYNGFTGISAAVPQVAGVATIISMVAPSLKGLDIASVLRATSTHIGPGTGLVYETGWGWPSPLAAIGEALQRDTANKIVAQSIVSTSYRDFELKVLDASSASVSPYYYTWTIDPSYASISSIGGYSTGRRIRVTRTASATGTVNLNVKFGPIGGRWVTRSIAVNFNGGAVNRVAQPATDSTEEIISEEKVVSSKISDNYSGSTNDASILAGPVPVHNDLRVSLVDSHSKGIPFDFVEINNINGQNVFSRKYSKSTTQVTIPVQGYHAGVYFLIVHSGTKIVSRLITISHN